jgi:hypothetical protein
MKDIEKYIGYYLLVYLIVLSVIGFFQYMAICQGKSLVCAFSMNGINTIITTTSYVLTPIVAIIGFINWKVQYNIQLEKDDLKSIKIEVIKFKELLQYFDIHFRDLYIDITNNNINDLNEMLYEYQGDKYELAQKRRNLSDITMKYYSTLENSVTFEKDSKELDDIYEKLNIYKWYIDVLIQGFSENDVTSFIHHFELFNFRSTYLIDYMKNEVDELNRKLKL